jgi:signal peptidase I
VSPVAWILLAVAATMAPAVAIVRRQWCLVTVAGGSMEPRLHDGDRLLVRRTHHARPGDLLVFAHPDPDVTPRWMVKRVVATAGDAVPVDLRPRVLDPMVPAGLLLVRGENANSQDSRHLGYIASAAALGIVRRRLNSPQRTLD